MINWFSSLFATRRELRRLAADNKYLRGRVESLEAENGVLRNTILERDSAWADRFLTGIAKTYAIGDVVKESIQRKFDIPVQHEKQWKDFLKEKEADSYRLMRESGASELERKMAFERNIPDFQNEFAELHLSPQRF